LKNKRTLVIGILVGSFLLTGIAQAITPLVISSPFFAAVGQNEAVACDSDGVTTSYEYGNSRNNGIKVNSVTVTGISVDCLVVKVIFIDGTDETSYTGSNTTGSVTIATNIWTNEFTDFRVVLLP